MTDPLSSLPNSEAYFRSLIEDALDIITVTDRTSKVVYASPAVQRVLGFRPEELVGQRVFKFIHPDDRFSALKVFGRAVLRPGTPQAHHFRHRHKDGSWRMLECIGKYVNDASGPPRIIANSRDITDLRNAVQGLRDAEEMYRQVLDSIADLVLVKGPKSHIRWANKAFREYYGMTNEQLLDVIDSPVNDPDFTEQYVKDDAHVFETGRVLDIPKEPVTRHDGVVRYFHTVKAPILNSEGKVILTVGVSRDMTDREHLEKIVRQSEKLSAVGQLAAGVAHEINNPLGVILGFAQGLAQRLKPDDPFMMPVKSIEREAVRCKVLVQDLLTFSRERKLGILPEEPIPVIEGALSLVETQARTRNVVVHREFSPNLPLFHVDRNQIQQVLINLCTNAMDAMPQGGSLIISLAKKDSFIEVGVRDTGNGIPLEIRQKIFEPFFTTKEVGKGTGLGLSLAYEVVKKHQGTIECQSEVGRGTIFLFRLPIYNKKNKPQLAA